MRHEWNLINQSGTEAMSNYGKRRCNNCGGEQVKEAEHSWGRVTGYRWLPLVGRCNCARMHNNENGGGE